MSLNDRYPQMMSTKSIIQRENSKSRYADKSKKNIIQRNINNIMNATSTNFSFGMERTTSKISAGKKIL